MNSQSRWSFNVWHRYTGKSTPSWLHYFNARLISNNQQNLVGWNDDKGETVKGLAPTPIFSDKNQRVHVNWKKYFDFRGDYTCCSKYIYILYRPYSDMKKKPSRYFYVPWYSNMRRHSSLVAWLLQTYRELQRTSSCVYGTGGCLFATGGERQWSSSIIQQTQECTQRERIVETAVSGHLHTHNAPRIMYNL